jgi:GDP-L-fucose synthase
MENYDSPEIINVGTGKEISIRHLSELIANIVGFQGKLVFDPSKPDGTPRKILDTSRINALGWKPSTELKAGVTKTYEWFKNTRNLPN